LTGGQTIFGRIAKLSSSGAPSLTTLQREILRFVIIIVSLAIALALLVIILWAAWLNRLHPGFITKSNLVIDIVSVCVAFVPEGLPACVTISLAVIANTLSKNKVLCKSLMTVETLGSVNVLCSDKTGTLTQNRMTVTSVTVLDDEYEAGAARDAIVAKLGNGREEGVKQVVAVAGICNGASFVDGGEDQPVGLRQVNGDATGQSFLRQVEREYRWLMKGVYAPDSAILRFAENVKPVKQSISEWNEVYKVNFSSKTKFMLKVCYLVFVG
jgi:sodium/potassium-transporting ATPase subunit alpha